MQGDSGVRNEDGPLIQNRSTKEEVERNKKEGKLKGRGRKGKKWEGRKSISSVWIRKKICEERWNSGK